jgi:hypothetical protein
MMGSHAAEYLIEPPFRLPDIHVMINVLISTGYFSGSFLYLYSKLFTKTKVE